MKNQLLITLALLAVGFVGCSSCDSNKPDVQKPLNPDTKLNINVKDKLRADDPKHLTPAEIVDKSTHMISISGNHPEQFSDKLGGKAIMTLPDDFKDRANARFLLYGEMIISKNQRYDEELKKLFYDNYIPDTFIKAREVVFAVSDKINPEEAYADHEVVAYIPQKVLDEAYPVIKEAFDKGDYETVYKTFDKAYTAVPISDAEWHELKEQGKL